MLVLMDSDGVVRGSVPGLAHFARVPVEDARRALVKLGSPDPETMSQEHEGRRIEPVEGGWRILQSAKYRDMMSLEERREYWRRKKAESRLKYSQVAEGLTAREMVRRRRREE